MKNLSEKIDEIKEGDLLAFSMSSAFTFGRVGLLVEYVTDKAILVDGTWIPKSQIVSVDLGSIFWEGIECKDIHLNLWFDEKLCKDNQKNSKFAY
jgi:hypothetical protein